MYLTAVYGRFKEKKKKKGEGKNRVKSSIYVLQLQLLRLDCIIKTMDGNVHKHRYTRDCALINARERNVHRC